MKGFLNESATSTVSWDILAVAKVQISYLPYMLYMSTVGEKYSYQACYRATHRIQL